MSSKARALVRFAFAFAFVAGSGTSSCTRSGDVAHAKPDAAPPPSARPAAPASAQAAQAAPAPAPAPPAEPADPCAGTGSTAKKTELSCADRKAWYEKLAWPSECEEAYDATAIRGTPAIEFHSIGTSRWVVEIQCTLGAYQGYSVFVLYDEAAGAPKPTTMKFRTYVVPRDRVLEPHTDTEVWGNLEWNDAKKELLVHNRHRGPGDCGSYARYAMRTGVPVVTEMRVQSVCDGKTTDPTQWPRVRAP